MATKKNDDLENNYEFNDQNQDDFNDVDDNFGLPDIEYNELDDEQEITSQTSQEQEYVPGSYTPPEEESSNAGKIIAIILIVIIVGVAIWYFGFHRPAEQADEKSRQEQLAKDKAAEEAAAKEAEEKRKAREAAEAEAARKAAEEAAKPKIGTIETISLRTGRYYVVVASAIDGDLAMDYAKKLSKQGVNITIIPPFGKSKFHRITVDNFEALGEADNRSTALKSTYGDGVWVIKY